MSWFYNSYSGELTSASGVAALAYEAAIHTGTGWHELPIPAGDTESQAAAYVTANYKGDPAPTTSISQGLANEPASGAKAVVGSLGNLAGFLGVGSISGTNLVIRAAKVIIGGLLLIIGLVHITGADNAVASLARKVPLPV
jgi:hypothetical protein